MSNLPIEIRHNIYDLMKTEDIQKLPAMEQKKYWWKNKIMHMMHRDKVHRNNSINVPLVELNEKFKADTVRFSHPYLQVYHPVTRKINSTMDRGRLTQLLKLFEGLSSDVRQHLYIAGGSIFTAAFTNVIQINDIDIFIVGASEVKAKLILQQVYDYFEASMKEYFLDDSIPNLKRVYRTPCAITFSNPFYLSDGRYDRNAMDIPRIQIVLRIYKSVSQLLLGFDIPCAALAMPLAELDKPKIYATDMAHFQLSTGLCIVDTDRRSLTFPSRLNKYLGKGMKLVFPYMNRSYVHQKMEEAAANPTTRYSGAIDKRARIHLSDCNLLVEPLCEADGWESSWNSQRVQGAIRTQRFRKKIRQSGNPNPDYYIWKNDSGEEKIAIMNRKTLTESLLSSTPYQPSLIIELEDKEQLFADLDMRDYLQRLSGVSIFPFDPVYKFEFRKVNPGSQWTNSFNPIIADAPSWYLESYEENVAASYNFFQQQSSIQMENDYKRRRIQ